MLSDLRPPGSVVRPTGAVFMRTCAGAHELQVYGMFHMPGTYMPPRGFDAMS